jgi:quinol monooxygenase YgiN
LRIENGWTNEWCAITHIDFRPSFTDRGAPIAALQAGKGPSLEEAEQVLRVLVAAERPPGTVDLTVLQQQYAANHFEVIGRFSSEAAYEAHLISTANLGYRRGVAPALASPYEDRLHSARGEQAWPGAGAGDVVVIVQIEIQPPRLDQALSLEELAAAQSADAAMSGQALLQRRHRPSNLELMSVWSSSEAFEEHLASGSAQASRSALASRLVAPIDVRPHRLFAGGWTTP